MRHDITAGVLVLALCVAASDAAAENLVANGGFELRAERGQPASWLFESAGRLAPVGVGLVGAAHSGDTALALTSNFELADYIGHSDPFALEGGEELIVSLYCRMRREPRAAVGMATYRELAGGRLLDTPPVQLEFHDISAPGNRWQRTAAHFRISPAANYGVLLLRIRGEGVWMVDDVAVVRRDVLRAEVTVHGLVEHLPNARVVQARVRNLSEARVEGIAELGVRAERGRPKTESVQFEVGPGADTLVDVHYSFDAKQSHRATLTLLDSAGQVVLERASFDAPALLELECLEPAFRSSVLSSLPTETCRVRCRVNATEPLATQIGVTAELHSTSGDAPSVSARQGTEPGEWELRAPARGAAVGRYELAAAAQVRGRRCATCEMPLWVLEPHRWEVGYDTHGVLHISGRPMLPIGVLGIDTAEALKDLADAGLNCVVSRGRTVRGEFLDQAHLRGIKVAVTAEPPLPAAFPAAAQRLAAHPAFLGWVVSERAGPPPGEERPPDDLQEPLAGLDPYHPVMGLLPDEWLASSEPPRCDIALAASRPLVYWPPETLAAQIDAIRRAARQAKPVWAVVQTDGLAWRVGESVGASEDGRPPTAAELRCMVYLAIVHGARGILYSAYHIPSRRGAPELLLPRDCPELWAGVIKMNGELQDLAPALLSPTGSVPVAAEPDGVHAALVGEGRDRLLVAVNATMTTLEAHIPMPPAAGSRGSSSADAGPRTGGRTMSISLAPLAVLVLRTPEAADVAPSR